MSVPPRGPSRSGPPAPRARSAAQRPSAQRPPARGSRPPARAPRPARPTLRLGGGLVAVLVMLTLIAGRLVWLQGFQAQAYAQEAIEQRTSTMTLTAPRGQVLDRSGEALALSVDARAVYGEPRTIARADCRPTAERPCDPAGIARALAPLLDLPAERDRGQARAVAQGDRRGLQPRAAAGLQGLRLPRPRARGRPRQRVRELGLVGIGVIAEPRRVHPGHDLAANVVGFTTVEGSGAAGIERRYDDVLAGTDGKTVAEVDGGGRIIPNGRTTTVQPRPGRDVQLTIDRDIQWNAQKVLSDTVAAAKAESASATVIDVKTGEVLALASVPTFDAEAAGQGRRRRARQPRRDRRLRAGQHRQGHHRGGRARGGRAHPRQRAVGARPHPGRQQALLRQPQPPGRADDLHRRPRRVEQRRHDHGRAEDRRPEAVRDAHPLRHRQPHRHRAARREPRASCATRRTSGPRPTTARTRSVRATRSTACRWRRCTPRSPTTASACSRRIIKATTDRDGERGATAAPEDAPGHQLRRSPRSCAGCSRASRTRAARR